MIASHIFVRTVLDQILLNPEQATLSDEARLNLKFFGATFFAVIIRYISFELSKDSPFDNPPTIKKTDPETDTRFNIMDGYPLTVEAINLKPWSS